MRSFFAQEAADASRPLPDGEIRRVERPTTLITDAVRQVPKRAGFFVRAFYGDLGPRPATEIRRFITKNPLNAAIGHLHWKHVPAHKGDPAGEQAPLPDDPEERTRHIKSLCHFLDADIVGVCEVPEYAWFSHESDGTPIETRHRYAVVIVIDQGWDTFEASSRGDWVSGGPSYAPIATARPATSSPTTSPPRHPAQAHSKAHGDYADPLMLLAGSARLSGRRARPTFIGRATRRPSSPPICRWFPTSRSISGSRISATSAANAPANAPPRRSRSATRCSTTATKSGSPTSRNARNTA